jgi:hypothetical protein
MRSNTDALLAMYKSTGCKLSEFLKELAKRGYEITVYSDYAVDYAQMKFFILFKNADSYSYMLLYEDDLAEIDDILKCGIENINKENGNETVCHKN